MNFSMLRKMFNEPDMPIDVDIWLEEGNQIDLGNFRLTVMYTPGHTSACISLFDQDKGLLFAADTLMPGGVMGGVFGFRKHQRLHSVAGAAARIELKNPAVGTRAPVGYASGRRENRACSALYALLSRYGTII